MFRRPIIAVLIATVLPVLVSGAGGAQTISLRTLLLQPGDMPEVLVKGAKETLPLKFSHVQPTPVVRVKAANPLPLYRMTTGKDGREKLAVAHSVRLPSASRDILLLAWKSGAKQRFLAIKDNFSSARFSDWLLVNTTDKPIAFQVGKGTRPAQLPPGVTKHHRVSAPSGQGAAVLATSRFGDKVKPFLSTYWAVYSDKRYIVLFIADGRKIRAKLITDKLLKPVKG